MSGWQAGQSDLSGCCGAQGGRVLVAVWAAITIRLVSRCPALSCSGGRRLKALAGSPFPSFPFFPSLLLSEEESFPLRRSGGSGLAERWRFVRSSGASPWERGGGRKLVVKTPLWHLGDPGMEHPAIGLPDDVATAEHVATSEEALPRSAALS
ncbi:hypothetical protein Taro_019785 [Colocasia esculenta]|uniref:Uncharacterized protein n=1 Tax=Colocasia esculenta TaxID=4460 RepID=A0A843V0C6_COLES|nr:hypothetical protein [Colocasia esculenta]